MRQVFQLHGDNALIVEAVAVVSAACKHKLQLCSLLDSMRWMRALDGQRSRHHQGKLGRCQLCHRQH